MVNGLMPFLSILHHSSAPEQGLSRTYDNLKITFVLIIVPFFLCITLKFSEHEEISYFPIYCIGSLRAECRDYADNHICCRHLECGAIDIDNGAEDACRYDPHSVFSDYFFILVFETVVSGKLDPYPHVDQQLLMGRRNFMFGDRL